MFGVFILKPDILKKSPDIYGTMTAHLTCAGCCILTAGQRQNNPGAERRAESDMGRRAETGIVNSIKHEKSTRTLSDDEKVSLWTAWTLSLVNRRSPHFLEAVHDAPVGAAFMQKRAAGFIFAASHRCIARINSASKTSLNLSAGRMRLKKKDWERNILEGSRADGRKRTLLMRLQRAQRDPIQMNQIDSF